MKIRAFIVGSRDAEPLYSTLTGDEPPRILWASWYRSHTAVDAALVFVAADDPFDFSGLAALDGVTMLSMRRKADTTWSEVPTVERETWRDQVEARTGKLPDERGVQTAEEALCRVLADLGHNLPKLRSQPTARTRDFLDAFA